MSRNTASKPRPQITAAKITASATIIAAVIAPLIGLFVISIKNSPSLGTPTPRGDTIQIVNKAKPNESVPWVVSSDNR